jgi:hypothetical protein
MVELRYAYPHSQVIFPVVGEQDWLQPPFDAEFKEAVRPVDIVDDDCCAAPEAFMRQGQFG